MRSRHCSVGAVCDDTSGFQTHGCVLPNPDNVRCCQRYRDLSHKHRPIRTRIRFSVVLFHSNRSCDRTLRYGRAHRSGCRIVSFPTERVNRPNQCPRTDRAGLRDVIGEDRRAFAEEGVDALTHICGLTAHMDADRFSTVRVYRIGCTQHAPEHGPGQRHRHRCGPGHQLAGHLDRPGRTCSGATTSRTSPRLSASAAGTILAPSTHSRAVPMPTSRGRNQLGAGLRDQSARVKTKPNLAVSEAIRMSAGSVMVTPDTRGRTVDGGDHRFRGPEDAQRGHPADIGRGLPSVSVTKVSPPAARSAPAQNALPVPVSTTARTASSASVLSSAAMISSDIWWVNALSLAGLSSRMIAIRRRPRR